MKKMSRLELIKGMGAMGALALAGPLSILSACSPASEPAPGSTGTADLSPDCVLTPSQMEGPFYIDSGKVRQDITEGRPGAPTRLVLTVVDARTCQPIPNAMVDVWHADAAGLYSAFPRQGDRGAIDTTGQTFLRGVQVTGPDGKASFTTLYPGWYPGRTTHIHFKLIFNNQTGVTSQLYMPDAPSQEIYTSHPAYTARGAKDTPNTADTLLRQTARSERLIMKVVRQGSLYVASNIIGIALG